MKSIAHRNNQLKRLMFDYHLILSVIAFLILIVVLATLHWQESNLTTSITFVGAILSFVYFVQKQQVEELKLFKELFQEFNARYDKLNSDLNAIVEGDPRTALGQEEIGRLDDYFNLCGKEFLYYSKGYIDDCVWSAWKNGMRYFLTNERILAKWRQEVQSDSYYGLNASVLQMSAGIPPNSNRGKRVAEVLAREAALGLHG